MAAPSAIAARQPPRRRRLLWGAVVAVLAAALAWAFMPRPLALEVATARRGPLRVSVEQEGRTRVIERYVVAAPVAGYARRIDLDAGSAVRAGAVLAQLEPLRPQAPDARSRAAAQARVSAAAASAAAARQNQQAAAADADLAQQELARLRRLGNGGYATRADLDRAAGSAARSAALLRSAEFTAATANADLAAARTALEYAAAPGGTPVALRSPIDGRVLRIVHKSEGPVAAGEALLEVGDPNALEVEVDLLSADAVQVHAGSAVRFDRWGGPGTLQGRVKRVEPSGFTKVSALGVEEQRVWVIVGFTSPAAAWQRLGDGYRLEASFTVWEGADVLQVPASSLFRDGGRWSVYVVEAGRARKRRVEPGPSDGLQTAIAAGVRPGQVVIAHPDERVTDGARVEAMAATAATP